MFSLLWLLCRSREGAWIEIIENGTANVSLRVAPVRERGLKFVRGCYEDVKRLVAPVRERGLKLTSAGNQPKHRSRSREGAWIEIIN